MDSRDRPGQLQFIQIGEVTTQDLQARIHTQAVLKTMLKNMLVKA